MVTELRKEVQALKQDQDGSSEENEGASPIAPHILALKIPISMRLSNLMVYTGDRNAKDPKDHINQFLEVMDILNALDFALCRIFRSTLTGRAQAWFSRLPKGSIKSFDQLRSLFIRQFACNRRYPKTEGHLITLVQGENETLREYMKRFADSVIDVPYLDPHFISNFAAQGTRPVEFADSLVGHLPRNLEDLMMRAERYMLREDSRLAKVGMHASEDYSQCRHGRGEGSHNRGRDPVRRYLDHVPLTPLKITNTEVLNFMKDSREFRWPPQPQNPEMMRHTGKWCMYHRCWGHCTKNYDQLRIEIEHLLSLG